LLGGFDQVKKIAFLNKRFGFMVLLLGLLWLKTMFAYFFEFDLGLDDPFQYVILIINPLATALFLFSVAQYIRPKLPAYLMMFFLYFLGVFLLYANVVYYGEFTDFLTVNTILGAGKVSAGLGDSIGTLLRPGDVLYFIDFLIIPVLWKFKVIKMEEQPVKIRRAFATSIFAVLLFSGNLFMAEADRPQLLSRTFSNDYMVKYLGLNAFTVYDGIQTYKVDKVRSKATSNDLTTAKAFVKKHYAAPASDKFGIAKGKNVIYIHLESFQQFLINYHLKDSAGVEHEVTPFLNSLYRSNETYSFDNFFHQVKAGKTSDAENLLENSLFALEQGSLFTKLGSKNTFEAAPNILQQTQGYTSAVFHGNVGSFWNRTETYKNLGYNYFFDQSYYKVNDTNSFQYGLNDKPFFQQSIQYFERLQQPFYTKFITVSNHFPYSELQKTDEAGFPAGTTGDATVDDYFQTANYLDTAVKEFFDYLKATGVYQNSVVVLYGDHYGISNTRNKSLATMLGKTAETWTDYDNAQMQRVPYMIHIPGQQSGGVNHTYGGEVDALPTLLHLLGVDTANYMQLGQDLLSPQHEQLVALRDGDYLTPDYTSYGGKLYQNSDGMEVTSPDATLKVQDQAWQNEVDETLDVSDEINNGNLLRFDTTSGLKAIDPKQYDYHDGLEKMVAIEQKLGSASKSIYSKNNNQTTVNQFSTQTYKQLNGQN
jgi:lipoteichoic acid synthase